MCTRSFKVRELRMKTVVDCIYFINIVGSRVTFSFNTLFLDVQIIYTIVWNAIRRARLNQDVPRTSFFIHFSPLLMVLILRLICNQCRIATHTSFTKLHWKNRCECDSKWFIHSTHELSPSPSHKRSFVGSLSSVASQTIKECLGSHNECQILR